MTRRTAAFVLIALSFFVLPACASNQRVQGCCTYGTPRLSTDAACRCTTCMWPPERGQLDPTDVPLTPSLNKFLGCPVGFDTPEYTRAPFCCDADTVVR